MPDRNPSATCNILIVDDHTLVREGLKMRLALEPDCHVCGEATSEDEALALVKSRGANLVLIDISLKSGNGLDLVRQIKSRYPKVRMLVISGFNESLYAERALRAGALGYLNKQESNEKLIEAIQAVMSGRVFLSPAMAQRLVSQALGDAVEAKTGVDRLSNRELEIFRMIGTGLSTGAIADQLFISTHTIDTHRENIKRKLALSSGAELTRAAVEWVLENP